MWGWREDITCQPSQRLLEHELIGDGVWGWVFQILHDTKDNYWNPFSVSRREQNLLQANNVGSHDTKGFVQLFGNLFYFGIAIVVVINYVNNFVAEFIAKF